MAIEASTAAAESALVFNPSNPKSSLISLNMSGITKLTATNFLTWRLQVRALLEAHELHGFISDEDLTPQQQITNAEGAAATNPAYTIWKRQDRMLYSSLIGTLTLNIQPMVARALTTRDIWLTLSNTYGKPSRGHVKQLKRCTKGTQSVTEYMRGIFAKADHLALLGSPLDHEDLLDIITGGLGDDYRAVVEMVNGRDVPISLEELHEKLLNRENDITAVEELSGSSVPVTANNTQTRSQRGGFRGNQASRGGYRNNQQSRGGYLGKCQICGIIGHSARRCPQFSSPVTLSQSQGQPPQWQRHPQSQQWNPQAHFTTSSPSDVTPWLVDSVASHHIASDLSTLSLHSPYPGGDDVLIGDGRALPITHTGSSHLSTHSRPLSLTNVLCVPTMKKNLISVNKLCKTNNVMVQMCPFDFQVKDLRTGATLLTGRANNGVYEWPTSSSSISAFSCHKTSLSDWHSRLGHPNSQTLRHIISSFSLPISSMSTFPCNSCFINKSHKLSFSTSSLSSTKPLDIIFSDVWTSPVLSIDGYKYYVLFVDHFTRYSWLYPMKKKSQVAQIFPMFHALVENRFQTKITTLYSDNGGEFIGLRHYLTSKGISHHTTPPHTPEHNGIAERKHRHIVETGLTLLQHAGIPHTYWSYSFQDAVYLINRLPRPILANSSPFQLLFKTSPNYTKLRTFGCLCYPWIRPYGANKFSPRSTPCVFLGYSLTQSAFICLDVVASRIYISRHVIFHESVFPFSSLTSSVSSSLVETSPSSSPSCSASRVPIFSWPPATLLTPSSAPSPTIVSPTNEEPMSTTVGVTSSSLSPAPTNIDTLDDSSSTDTSDSPPQVSSLEQDPVVATAPAPVLAPVRHPMITRSKNNIVKPNTKYCLSAILTEIEPRNDSQALKDERWRRAMGSEIDAQTQNHTWDLVDRALARNIVGCRWVYRIKRLPNGSIDRFKARLVAKGFHQRPGVDFEETFSPVIKHATIRLVLGVAVARDWPLRQVDVNHAFLQGPLQEEVYMLQPPGFIDKDRPNHVCRLRKAIYGLKQAPRAWYNALRDFLLSIGFVNSLADASMFVLNKGGVLVYILIYVDDFLITGNNSMEVSRIIQVLAARFSLKDLGNLSYFLGMEAYRDTSGLHLTQTKYITDLLVKTNMASCKPVSTPMCSNDRLTAFAGSVLDDPTEFRTIVGSLQYLLLTRPDIAFAVNRLSQYMHRPTTVHFEAVKRILRYLAGTPTKGIFFSRTTPLNLHAYSDADWAGNQDDYSSTGAYIVYLGKQPISWCSKKLKGVARSSTEAEYRSVAITASEVKWLVSLMAELGIPLVSTPTIFCDNVGATYLCANPVFHSRMKHLALDYHFVREQVQSNKLRVSHITSADQLADALTKPLPRTRFHYLATKIGLSTYVPTILRGRVRVFTTLDSSLRILHIIS
ncbi:GAG-pre-integrase domain [Arabidopsis suecica]|uniref:GAG-pre-integrase domain n=1 Tax=Arabidopsis suecica TaxID=45249 RepID=A0A8T2BSA6_ARASU|nr:GAG-pre-integrase domain [Arabidopsis suecica]